MGSAGEGKASNAGLACVYLSEFGVAAAAFTLHSPEPKIIKVRLYIVF